MAAPRAAPTALLLAARMRHAEGDLAGAREAFDAVLGEPDPATQTTGLTYLGLLLEHADQFAEAAGCLTAASRPAGGAGLFRPLLTSCFAATLACANLGDLSGALDRLALLERLLAGDHGRAAALLERSGGQLDRPFGYRWRVELRHAELTSRLDPPAAEGLLKLARTYGSTKYQALALARLGRRPEAAELAAASGSDYLLAQVAPPAQARAAVDRIAASLPPELRPAFLSRGPLAAAVAGA